MNVRCIRSFGAWLSLVAGLVLAVRAAAAPPPERDVWYVISDGPQRYGSMHVVVRQRDHGQIQYDVESLVKIEFLGAPQELQSTSSTIVDPRLALVSMLSESSRLSGGGTLRGRAIENGYVVAHETEHGVDETTRTFDDDIPAISNFALGAGLHSTGARHLG